MTEPELRALGAAALTEEAFRLGLAPDTVYKTTCPPGQLWETTRGGLIPWRPTTNLAQADAAFRRLRARGWSTSVVWFADDRQYGSVWACCGGRAYSARWPLDVPSEAHAILLTSVLVVALGNKRTLA